jgi:hypothetical protein
VWGHGNVLRPRTDTQWSAVLYKAPDVGTGDAGHPVAA